MKTQNHYRKIFLIFFSKFTTLLFNLSLPNLIAILILIFVWLFKEKFDLDEDNYDFNENDSKLSNLFKFTKQKILNFILLVFIPIFCILYNLFTKETIYDDNLNDKKSYDIKSLRAEIKNELSSFKNNFKEFKDDLNDTKKNINSTDQKIKCLLNNEIENLKNNLSDKLNDFSSKFSFLETKNFEKFSQTFETADIAVDFIKKRDDHLKELFKITTEINLKNDLLEEDLKHVKSSYLELIEDIKKNNLDLAKFVQDNKQFIEDSLSNKIKIDQLKLYNEIENIKTENNLREKDNIKLNLSLNNIEQKINSVKEKFTEYDKKINQCTDEIDEFRNITENLTIYLNTDITGKINGILNFLGKN